MIILKRITSTGKETETGFPLHNFISCNCGKDNETWVAQWDGEKVFRSKVNHTVKEVQLKVFVARHGKKPSAGLFNV